MFGSSNLVALALSLLSTSLASPIKPRWNYAPDRVIAYEAFYRDQQNNLVPLLPIIKDNSEITHLLLFASDVHETQPYLTLGGVAPYNSTFLGPLWDEVQQIRDTGVQIYTSLGGYLANSFILLEQDFDYYYPFIKDFISHLRPPRYRS